MKKLAMIMIVTLMMALVGCNSSEEAAESNETSQEAVGYEEVDVAKAQELIEQGATVVDVRTAEEYAEGHIPGSILIPLEEVESRLSEFNADETYVMVCRSGNRSGQASDILVNNGITSTFNMLGGMKAWDGEVVTE